MECRATAAKSTTVAGSSGSTARKAFARSSQKSGKVRGPVHRALGRQGAMQRHPELPHEHVLLPHPSAQLPGYTGLRIQQQNGQIEAAPSRAVGAAARGAAPVAELEVRGPLLRVFRMHWVVLNPFPGRQAPGRP